LFQQDVSAKVDIFLIIEKRWPSFFA
jgi:hypothetical protein